MTPFILNNNHIKKHANETQTFPITLIYTKKIMTLKKDTYITLFIVMIF